MFSHANHLAPMKAIWLIVTSDKQDKSGFKLTPPSLLARWNIG